MIPRRRPEAPSDIAGQAEAAPLRDADAILALAQADEEAAAEARRRFRESPLRWLAPDPAHLRELDADEGLIADRASAIVHDSADDGPGAGGRLWVTTRRVLHLGPVPLSLPLAEILELDVVAERLLLTLSEGRGLAIEASGPRLLRVEIAAAMAAARG